MTTDLQKVMTNELLILGRGKLKASTLIFHSAEMGT